MIQDSLSEQQPQWSLRSWVSSLPLARKGFLLISVAFGIQALVIVFYGALVERSEFLNTGQQHHKEVIGRVNWLSSLILSSSLTSVAHAVSGDEDYRKLFDASTKSVEAEFALMAPVVENDSVEAKNLQLMNKQWQLLFGTLTGFEGLAQADFKKSIASDGMKHLWRDLALSRQKILAEEALQFPMTKHDFISNRNLLKILLNVIFLLDIACAGAMFYIFCIQIVHKIMIVADNSKRLADGVPLNPPLTGKDELQQLDRGFHSMADKLTAARIQLEESERRTTKILSDLPLGVVVIRPDLTIEFANNVAKTLFDYTDQDFVNMKISELIVDGKLDLEQRLSTADENSFEGTVRKGNNTTFRAEISSSTIQIQNGQRTLLAFKDITERYELERMKREFVSMVCHDLRNPLSSIQLFFKMLEMGHLGVLTGNAPKLLDNVTRCTDNLLTLTNDMLDIDRIEYSDSQGTLIPLAITQVNLDTVIEQSIANATGQIRPKNIQISYAPVDAEFEFECDELKLLRILNNLLTNAAKFSPPDSIITISTTISGAELTISISDQGRGIPEEKLPDIFNKFEQVRARDAATGSGLGLTICKKFVESHGGRIGVASKLGEGSTFWFSLPLKQPLKPSQTQS